MPHQHFCEIGGHEWMCEGRALRPFMGDTEPCVCMCMRCQLPMEMVNHPECQVELVACSEHVGQELDLMKEVDGFLCTPDGRYMAELFTKRDALADGDPEKDAVVTEILRHTFACINNRTADEDGAGGLMASESEPGKVK